MQATTNERARLFVDGVPSAILADVNSRRDDGMVVTQALPFLRLSTLVRGDDGRHARIARVTIDMDGDVPRLRLELQNDDPPTEASSDEDRAGDADASEPFTPGLARRPVRTDATVPYDLTDGRPSREVVLGPASIGVQPLTPTHTGPTHVPLWLRAWRRIGAWLSSLARRPAPALPPS